MLCSSLPSVQHPHRLRCLYKCGRPSQCRGKRCSRSMYYHYTEPRPFTDNLRLYVSDILSSDLFLQLAPFVVIFLVPALVLTASAYRASFSNLLQSILYMVLETLSAVLPWNWYSNNSHGHSRAGSSGGSSERRKLKKRTRSQQTGTNGVASGACALILQWLYRGCNVWAEINRLEQGILRR